MDKSSPYKEENGLPLVTKDDKEEGKVMTTITTIDGAHNS